MSIYQFDLVRYWPGSRDARLQTPPKVARVISDGTVTFGGRPCYWISKQDGGTDYIAVTHIELLARMDDTTAYVQTMQQAMEVCDQRGVDNVVIEDPAERVRLRSILRGFGLA